MIQEIKGKKYMKHKEKRTEYWHELFFAPFHVELNEFSKTTV